MATAITAQMAISSLYVNKTFETTPTSQPEVRMSMWVEDPTNPKARAAACRTYFTLG